MRSFSVLLALAAALAAPTPASAQSSPLAGNVSLVSDYRFRGLTQTFEEPALQGGFDFAHPSGFYAGNWNSSIADTFFAGAPLEMDFYGGYKGSAGSVGYDLGLLYYYYPGSDPEIDNTELYAGASWKWLSARVYYAVSDFFGLEDTDGSTYVDLGAAYDLGGGWGINAHVGHQKVEGRSELDYTDYRLGVTKDLAGWLIGAAFVDTDADEAVYTATSGAGKSVFVGDSTVVLSFGKTF